MEWFWNAVVCLNQFEIHWDPWEIYWNALRSIGNQLKSIGNVLKSIEIDWKSIEIYWKSMEIRIPTPTIWAPGNTFLDQEHKIHEIRYANHNLLQNGSGMHEYWWLRNQNKKSSRLDFTDPGNLNRYFRRHNRIPTIYEFKYKKSSPPGRKKTLLDAKTDRKLSPADQQVSLSLSLSLSSSLQPATD